MGEEPDQIERHIDATRGQLGENLAELERKVKNATDWRMHFQRNPFPMMGAAFAGGLLLSMVVGRRSGSAEKESRKECSYED
jgi:hypothetical protein